MHICIYALKRTYWETKVWYVRQRRYVWLSRVSVLCGTINISKCGTRTLVAIYESGTRRAWGREDLSWSLPTSNIPLLLLSPSPGVATIIYIFDVFCTPRWRHRGSSSNVSNTCTGFPINTCVLWFIGPERTGVFFVLWVSDRGAYFFRRSTNIRTGDTVGGRSRCVLSSLIWRRLCTWEWSAHIQGSGWRAQLVRGKTIQDVIGPVILYLFSFIESPSLVFRS